MTQAPAPPPPRETASRPTPWHQEPLVILVLAFTLLGPFAIPMVWQTPKFSKGIKVVLTVVLVVLTLAAMVLTAWVVWLLVVHFRALAEAMRELGLQ